MVREECSGWATLTKLIADFDTKRTGALLALACGYALAVASFITLMRLGYGVANVWIAAAVVVVVTAAPVLFSAFLIRRLHADHRRIAESEQRFRRAMEDSVIGVAIVSLGGQIEKANPAFAAMLGYSAAELEAKTFFEITHPEDLSIGKETMTKVRAGEADSYHFEKRYLRKDGSAVWAQLAGSVIRDDETGKPLYMVSQIEDIDARKKSEARIDEAETRWNFALASAGQGIWELDMRKGGVSYSATWKDMLGYAHDELDGDPDRWLTLVHPDDRDRVQQLDRDHIEGRTPHFEAEFRMLRKDGSWIWIMDRGKVVERDAQGHTVRAIGTLTDITARKQAEERLAVSAALLVEEKERLRITLQSIGDAVICTDADNRITFLNPVAEKLLRIDATAALGNALKQIYLSVDEETGVDLNIGVLRASHNARAVLIRRDGTRCSIREMVTPMLTESGSVGGSVIVFQDFTDARTLQRELTYAASHDALTGLANRASFMRALEAVMEERPDADKPHRFVYVDLDNFKPVNDTGGHAAGDALLKRVADTLRSTVRPGDVAARLRGREFAVIFKSRTGELADTMADRLVRAIAAIEFDWEGRIHRIGASGGLTAIRFGVDAIDEIIARADAACYAAKAAGRGRVVTLDHGESSARLEVKRAS